MSTQTQGLIVHQGSRTERLAGVLARLLEEERPANPLEAQIVVVAHPGLRRWLLGEMAQRPGRLGRGIAANYNMIEPWEWLKCETDALLGNSTRATPYQPKFMRWHIFAALPALNVPQISNFLAGSDSERRRFQLAEHLAGVFEQYLIYRPKWILDWESGADQYDWQAALWRKVHGAIKQLHRAHRSAALLEVLRDKDDGKSEPLHIFGVSHLPPDILNVVRALSQRRLIHLYFPNPCREYWSDLKSRRELSRIQGDAKSLYYEVGHPLLVSLGRTAQDFCIALDDMDAQIDHDEQDFNEPREYPVSLLASVQSSIRCAQPDIVGTRSRDNTQGISLEDPSLEDQLLALRNDESLRVHLIHTRLRELEVLKNALLGFLSKDSTLRHRDIVVMSPAIAQYAPLLPAVFGEAARYESDPLHIPWHIADIALANTHPLMSAFSRLLDLAESRFAVSEVMDFLDVPAVARRFQIDAEARASVERLLRGAHVAWGLDAQMKAEAGAAPVEANSWKFGFDRLYAGLIIGDDGALELLDGVLPAKGVSSSADELGQIDRLLEVLRRARSDLFADRTLTDWSDWLLDKIDALFLVDARDTSEVSALDGLRRLIASLKTEADAAGPTKKLAWIVVREALQSALKNPSERQSFLLGGVTFCGLVPQRSIPFRVVCLLGMNEGEFPRINNDDGLNQMLAHPRRGDRDTRTEDRYLFLEALMSAREHLHISYIGESVRDGQARNSASPLTELLQFLDEQFGLKIDDKLPRPWLIRHPLQPFDARYYRQDNDHAIDGTPRNDPRLFSYAHGFTNISATSITSAAKADASAFLVNEDRTPEISAATGEISLAALKRFWRDPAKAMLRDVAGLSLDAIDSETWPDREPLEAKVDRRERIERKLLFDAILKDASELPVTPPAWLALSGVLAAGVIGEAAYTKCRDRAAAVLAAARERLGAQPERTPQTIDIDLGDDLRLSGAVENIFRCNDGSSLLFEAKPTGKGDFREFLSFYIDFAALQLMGENAQGDFVEYVENTASPAKRPVLLDSVLKQNIDELRAGLRKLIVASQSDVAQLLFLPKTAWAWASNAPDKRFLKSREAWEGDHNKLGERDYAPGYSRLMMRGLDLFDRNSSWHGRFVIGTELVAGVLDPHRLVLFSNATNAKTASSSRRRSPKVKA